MSPLISFPEITLMMIPLTTTLLILLPPLIIFLLSKHYLLKSKSPPIPPGPFRWPIVGNLFQIGPNPQVTLARFAKTYGPDLFSFKLGTKLVVVGSSPPAAMAILKTHDRNLCARFVPHVAPSKCLKNYDSTIGWVDECNESWKNLRTFSRTELFSAKAINSQAWIRDQKVNETVKFVAKHMQGKAVKVREIAFGAVLNMMGNILVSKDMIDQSQESLKGELCEVMNKITDVASSPNISDFYPILGSFDLQNLQKRSMELFDRSCQLWEAIVQERKASETSPCPPDFLDALIKNDFSTDDINVIFMEFFGAGTETSSSIVEWTMAELIQNPRCMKIVQEELAKEIGPNNVVKECDLPKLTYLQACIKEILRLHPVGPLLLPHRAIESCTVMNYTIPKDSQILVNVWAVGRDPSLWEEPLVFKPERFLNSSLDFKGNNFEYFPFGSGRRICPGMPMAAKQIPLIVAALIHSFDWSLPQGKNLNDIDMTEKYGIAMRMEKPLVLVPKAKINIII
ncbi:probable (S)-N-methylcoclaurine 3'-hydroxylase isozyme 2 [Humulus lupulus]|uniref:probable (S)-N-methylcoclaurine 3'-hydroxylase isozyme 2 n=1 Tax=Humulus lupulus TaxID=3486 RepID=UPI002B403BDB|nr:probable (S)-N-methylcoclaurine 3'-hydroxylase isozyme 2 [Humulus lupulus]